MKSIKLALLFFALPALLLIACNSDDETGTLGDLPGLTIFDAEFDEGDVENVIQIPFNLSKKIDANVLISYATIDGTAKGGLDYMEVRDGQLTVAPNTTSAVFELTLLGNEIKEGNREFQLLLQSATNANLIYDRVTITILDDDNTDVSSIIPATGYEAAGSYPGKTLVWSEEFDGDKIDEETWNFEIGNGDNGWGNNELQFYKKENAFIQDGHLVIEAKQESSNGYNYTSTRMTTQNKKDFQYGRIDVRAALPEGQGIWPAIWMLGSDFQTEGWPACGEIDIMELIGNEPGTTHSTVHFGSSFAQHRYVGESQTLADGAKFSEEFHVFSLEWEEDKLKFLVDDVQHFEFSTTNTGGQPYPFNDQFFFILNVAVGGNWPGSPNSSTVFPQYMIVDYLRVYQ